MKRNISMFALVAGAMLLASCGNKDDQALLLPLGMQASQSIASPAVPQEDLTPVTGNNSGSGNVNAITGPSATPASSGSSGSESGSSAGGSSGSGSEGGSSAGGSSGSGSEGGSSAGGSSGSGSEGGSSAGGSSGSGGEGGSSAGGSSGSGSEGGSSAGGSSGSGSEGGSSAGGSSGSGSSTPALNTSASFTGKDYSAVEGKWYLDGTTLFTYDKGNSVSFPLTNMQSGTYRVTIEGKHWVKHDSVQGLPAGFSAFNLMVGAGSTAEASLKASSTEYKTVTVDIVVPEGKSVLLISWLNQVCGTETPSSSAGDSKSKDSKSKDSKSKDSKSKDSKSKDSKSKDSKSKDSKSKDSKSKDSKDSVSVCHVPPGNPANKHTIVVSQSALKAHLGHGDSEGGCAVCANFGVRSVKVERIGETGLSAYIGGTKGQRNLLIAGIIVLIAAMGIAGIRLMRNPAKV